MLARASDFPAGEVGSPTPNIGAAVFVRDPDGQLVELLPMGYRRHLEASPTRRWLSRVSCPGMPVGGAACESVEDRIERAVVGV